MASKQSQDVVQIDRIGAETIIVPIVGTSPLIVHRFSEKAKREMLDRSQGKKNPRQAKDPRAEFEAAAYVMGEEKKEEQKNGEGVKVYGFPAIAFKAATVSAARFYRDVTMTALRQFLFFSGIVSGPDRVSLIPIIRPGKLAKGEEWPRIREDVVRVGMGAADLRYRPEFWPWSAELTITYVKSALTQGSVLSLIDAGGLGVGVGEWRPERGGDFGQYKVDLSRDVQVITER